MSRPPALPPPKAHLLTPLGPGGRPFARWRPVTAAMALVVLLASAVLLLSDRAPGLLRRLSLRIDSGSSRAAQVASRARPQSDFEIHVLVWAIVALLLGLTMWSNRSVLISAVTVFAGSVLAEWAQQAVTTTRNLQAPDVVANGLGALAGLGAVCGLAILLGWDDPPARPRGHTRAIS